MQHLTHQPEKLMKSLPDLLSLLWGRPAGRRVAQDYRALCSNHPLFLRDLAVFCNAAAPITGTSGFERGIEEGKRRVWLHIARLAALQPQDFVEITDRETTHD
jgi:hypothetical protein